MLRDNCELHVVVAAESIDFTKRFRLCLRMNEIVGVGAGSIAPLQDLSQVRECTSAPTDPTITDIYPPANKRCDDQ